MQICSYHLYVSQPSQSDPDTVEINDEWEYAANQYNPAVMQMTLCDMMLYYSYY